MSVISIVVLFECPFQKQFQGNVDIIVKEAIFYRHWNFQNVLIINVSATTAPLTKEIYSLFDDVRLPAQKILNTHMI